MNVEKLFLKIRALPSTAFFLLALLGAVFAYYYYTWGDLQTFAVAIDHEMGACNFLCDFKQFFLPMGRSYFSTQFPVPGFYYSAFAGLLFVPFGWFSDDGASMIWASLQIALLIPLCRTSPSASLRILYIFLIVTSLPMLNNFKWGQTSVLLTTAILSSFCLHIKGHKKWSASLLATAASIKYYPALFALYFLAKRDGRSFSLFTAIFLLLFFFIPVSVLGYVDWILFQNVTFTRTTYIGPYDPNSQYFAHVLAQWVPVLKEPWNQETLQSIGIAIGGVNVGLLFLLQKLHMRYKEALSISILCLSLPFLVHSSWPNYFVYLPFCQVALLAEVYERSTTKWRWKVPHLFIIISSMVLSSIFVFNSFTTASDYSRLGILFWANALLLVEIYALLIRDVMPTYCKSDD